MPVKSNKPGRPKALVPSGEDRRRVELGIAAGVSQTALADLFGISLRTFGRTFAREIEVGHAKVTVEMLLTLHRAASRGNAAAAKAVLAVVGRSKPDSEPVVQNRWAGLAERIHNRNPGFLPDSEISRLDS
jgi:hypothetical protein